MKDRGPDVHGAGLDRAAWRKPLISYIPLASYLTRTSLVPTSPAAIISSPAKFKIAGSAARMGVGGTEG